MAVHLTEDETKRLKSQAARWGATEEGRIRFATKFEVSIMYLPRLASGTARPFPSIARLMLSWMEESEL